LSIFEELKRRNVIRVGVAYGIAAWFLLQISDLVLENIAAPDWVMQTIMLVLAIGFPVIVLFAWAFEMTPEGIKREKDVDRTTSITNQTGRNLDRMIIGVLVITVGYLLVDKLVIQKGSEPFSVETASQTVNEEDGKRGLTPDEGPSVAVLPFVNMSGDQENEYFSDGLTETLLHMLAQLPDLRVAARTSSFAFKGQNKDITEIAEALNVAHILEGSVQKADNRVRVTAQLIKAEDGSHVWSQNYTRPLEDIFAIQDEIAEDVADALGASLLAGTTTVASLATSNLSAYDNYLKGLEQQAIFSYGSLGLAENHFKQALVSDPGFTDARLSLVRNYLYKNGTGLITNTEMRSAIEPLLGQVRQQEPDNRLGRALKLTMELQTFDVSKNRQETTAIVNELRNTLYLIPTETYIRERVAATLAFYFQQDQQALEVVQAGLLIDPLEPDLHGTLGDIYSNMELFEEARLSLHRALELAPENPNTYGALSYLEKNANNLPAALDWMRKSSEVDPQDHELAAQIAEDLFHLKLPEEGERWYARVQALAPGSAVARNMEFHRALARNEREYALELARNIIADQVDMRRGSFTDALFEFASMMLEDNRAKEGFEFLISVRPDVADYDQLPTDSQGLFMQWAGMALIAGFETPENRDATWAKLTSNFNAMGFPWLDDPSDQNHIWNYVLTGQPEKAIDHYLEQRLTLPMARNLLRHQKRLVSIYGEVYADPRVMARQAELDKEFMALRSEVQEMLQGEEWQ
jgi:TolB-like protein/tetratricopeptide (TPR) repeat protein